MAKGNTIAARKQYDDWEVEDALRTLQRAEEIEKDTKLMAKVKALAQQKLLDLAAIAKEGSDGS